MPAGLTSSPQVAPRSGKLLRAGGWLAAGVLLVALIAGVEVSLPADLGTWAPAALPGEAVFVLTPATGGLLVGSAHGLSVLTDDGSLRDLGVHARVNALVQQAGLLLVGTDDGLIGLPPAGGPAETVAFAGVDVQSLAAQRDTLWAGTATGLLRRSHDGLWQRSWPEPGQPDRPVVAVLGVDGGVLFAHPDGLALLDSETGAVHVVYPGVSVVALLADPGGMRIWAGLRGGPLLLSSSDAGRNWVPRSAGLGFTAVNAIAMDPSRPGRLLAGGSGLADGSGNAGVQTSDDGGFSWQAQQGQLSNTHVFALEARQEPARLAVRLAGLPGSVSLPLPIGGGRVYAGTNGGGVYTHRPDSPVVDLLARGQPALRLFEPVLAGLLLLACVAPAYHRLVAADRVERKRRRPPGAARGRAEERNVGRRGGREPRARDRGG